MDESTKKWLIIALVIAGVAVIAYLVWKYIIKKPSAQQAAQVPVQLPTTVPSPSPSTTLQPFTVQNGSFLAQFAGLPVTINPNIPELQIGDSYWVPVNAPNGVLVLVPFSVTTAQARIAAGLLVPGNSYIVQVVPTPLSEGVELKQQSSTYAAYGTQQITLTAGMLRDIMRGNKSLFVQLYQALQTNNTPMIESILASVQNNQQLYNIVKTLASSPNNMPAPLAISYNVGITLGIVPPQIQSYITNPNNVVIDFGYL